MRRWKMTSIIGPPSFAVDLAETVVPNRVATNQTLVCDDAGESGCTCCMVIGWVHNPAFSSRSAGPQVIEKRHAAPISFASAAATGVGGRFQFSVAR
jgi:hypothetical protein